MLPALALLRRPAWSLGALVAAATVALCASLGLWQLDRLAQRRALNAQVEAGLTAPPAPLDELLAASTATGDVDDPDGPDVEYRRVAVRGTFEPASEALLTPRTRGGQPGFDVVTPLRLDDGRALLVDRGWVPYALDTPPIADAPPPAGTATVEGFLRRAGQAARWSPRDGGPVVQASAVDVDLLAPQVGGPVVPGWYVAAQDGAAVGDLPRPVEDPLLDEGPHRSYAVQWFLFAAVVALGFPVLLRSRTRERAAGSTGSDL